MGHGLDVNAPAIAVAPGVSPWHNLVNDYIQPGDTLDQIAVKSRMDFEIHSAPVLFEVEDHAETIEVPERRVFYRSDNLEWLAVHSDQYKVFQPMECLEWFDELRKAAPDNFTLETCGVLKGGTHYWALVKVNEHWVVGDELIQKYLLVMTACDGTMTTRFMDTSVCVVCMNTFRAALFSNAVMDISYSHRSSVNVHEVAQRMLESYEEVKTHTEAGIDHLASKGLTATSSAEYFREVLEAFDKKPKEGNDEEAYKKALELREKRIQKMGHQIIEAFLNAPGQELKTRRDTMWGAFNAVTNYVDFSMGARNDGNRFISAQTGKGAELKQIAADVAWVAAA